MKLVCNGLSTGYRRHAELLKDVDINFHSGVLYALMGENGAGKSCLLKTVAGLLRPLAGEVHLQHANDAAADATTLLASLHRQRPMRERARWQGYLEQQARPFWSLPVRDIVALGADARRDWSPEEAENAIELALRQCQCQSIAERPVLELSAGEQQRVLLARVLAATPRVLLVDEPTAGLDPRHQQSVMQLLKAQAEQGALVIAVMHDIALARQFCDQVVLLGREPSAHVVSVGKPDQVLQPETLYKVFGIRG
ncbi:hypothetical protein CWE12_11800 [Aliidiomarina sedimenti]|uniref:ABC transporter domain-containing protein n=1 Tax=Aliidiomarina sedimenti TaxID=1933879 RepID=A0ABY0BX81_9GAMM|nr:ABC transporter ATP-binding protein [Aliidiomarina sedimenti]RUO28964.1 hypothetical protein CWE12_11800 [Aliidiomarina sedimenti]